MICVCGVGRFSLFLSHKYVPEHLALDGKTLSPGRYLDWLEA